MVQQIAVQIALHLVQQQLRGVLNQAQVVQGPLGVDLPLYLFRDFDETLDGGEHLVGERAVVNLEHAVVRVQLRVLLDLAHVSQIQHNAIFILKKQLLHRHLHKFHFLLLLFA